MEGLSGVAGAGPIFRRTMIAASRGMEPTWFNQPESLTRITIDPRTGKRLHLGHASKVSEATAHSMSGAVIPSSHQSIELCPMDSLPLLASDSDYSPDGFALLDQSYSEWLASDHNRRRSELKLAPDQPAVAALRILAPRPDTTYILDPELPNGGHLHLATNLPGLAEWTCDTLTLTTSDADPTATLTPGTHTLTATDPRNGESIPVTLTVEVR